MYGQDMVLFIRLLCKKMYSLINNGLQNRLFKNYAYFAHLGAQGNENIALRCKPNITLHFAEQGTYKRLNSLIVYYVLQ